MPGRRHPCGDRTRDIAASGEMARIARAVPNSRHMQAAFIKSTAPGLSLMNPSHRFSFAATGK
jgi:hypothetical protein